VAQIDTTHTNLSGMFLGHEFHIPHLYQFISCAENLKLSNRAFVGFWVENVYLSFVPPSCFKLGIRHNNLHEQVSSMAAACRQLSPLLPRVDRLDLLGRFTLQQVQPHLIYLMQWQGLFYSFIAVQSLHVSKKLRPLIASALQALTGERGTEALPRLLYFFYQGFRPLGPVHEATKPFVTARQLSSLPMTVVH
jgi:hypothetical protein